MRGTKPGFWKKYEKQQLGVAAACMVTTTKHSTLRHAAKPARVSTAVAPSIPRLFFVVGPVLSRQESSRFLRG